MWKIVSIKYISRCGGLVLQKAFDTIPCTVQELYKFGVISLHA